MVEVRKDRRHPVRRYYVTNLISISKDVLNEMLAACEPLTQDAIKKRYPEKIIARNI